ncbi:hypothetical protein BH09BAC4_BH09BAC4_29040 [soil metagenome]
MAQSTPTRNWQLLIIRGLLYGLLGVSMLLASSPPMQLFGGLLVSAGVCGCIYAIYSLQIDRNYFWEALRSLADIGFGIWFLVYSQGDVSRFLDVLGFWGVMYVFIQAVQTIYAFMLLGLKQPRNRLGNLLHFGAVLASGAIAFTALTSAAENPPLFLIGILLILLGLIIIFLAIQQRQTLLADKPV